MSQSSFSLNENIHLYPQVTGRSSNLCTSIKHFKPASFKLLLAPGPSNSDAHSSSMLLSLPIWLKWPDLDRNPPTKWIMVQLAILSSPRTTSICHSSAYCRQIQSQLHNTFSQPPWEKIGEKTQLRPKQHYNQIHKWRDKLQNKVYRRHWF